MRGFVRINRSKLLFAALIFICLNACEKDEPKKAIDPAFNEIYSVIAEPEGALYVAGDRGLFSFNNGKWKEENIPSVDVSIIYDLSLASNLNGYDLWLATDAGAVNQSKGEILNSSNSELPFDEVREIFIDHKNRSYFAGNSGVSINSDGNWYETSGAEDIFLDFPVSEMATASNDWTYVTTLGGGIGRFMVDTDGISGATVFNEDWTKLNSNNILTVFIDDTVQWYGTDRGVAVHFSEFTKWDWEVYDRNNGLAGDTVYSICKDATGNMWFGTNNGVSRFDGEDWSGYTVSSHQLLSDTISNLAAGTDGSVWLVFPKGISVFKDELWTNYSK